MVRFHLLLALLGLSLTGCIRGDEPDADPPDPDVPMTPMDEFCEATDPRDNPPEIFLGPDGLSERIVQFVDGAQTSVDMAIYLFNDVEVRAAMVRAKNRGVTVRIVMATDHIANRDTVSQLRTEGLSLVTPSSMFQFYHPKFVIADRAAAIIMSANLNQTSINTERNHGVVLRDPNDVADLVSLFESDFSGGETVADVRCTRLVISPNNSRDRVHALIESATSTLDFQQLSFSDREIRDLVEDAVDRGVVVRIALADPRFIEGNVESAEVLSRMGAEVRTYNTLENHAKLIVADRAAAFVGSVNISFTSLERNREVGVVVTAPSSVGTLNTAFDQDWNTSSM